MVSGAPATNSETQRRPLLEGGGRRALGGFFLSGVLFSFLGAALPAWGYHIKSDHLTVAMYFLWLAIGIYVGTQLCQLLAGRAGLRTLLVAGCAAACAGLGALAWLSGPAPAEWRMGALFVLGSGTAILSTAIFYAIAPLYEYDSAATLNLGGMLFGLGALGTALAAAWTIEIYTATSMIALAAVAPFYYGIWYAKSGPISYRPRAYVSFLEALKDFRSPGAVFFALLLFFQFANEWAIAGWLPLFLIQKLGIAPASGLLLLSLYFAALVVGRILTQALLPRVSNARMLMGSVLAALAGCVLLSLTEKMGGAVAAVLLIGAGFSSIYPLSAQSVGHRFPYYHPGLFNSIYSLGLTGGVLSPFLMGVIAHYAGLGAVMLAPAVGSTMVALLVLLIWLEARLSHAHP
jgi:MFS transporter, FHS family, glucose/mannose:H+ symporter